MKFGIAVGIRDVVTHANFGFRLFRRFRMAGVEFHVFPLNFDVFLITLDLALPVCVASTIKTVKSEYPLEIITVAVMHSH